MKDVGGAGFAGSSPPFLVGSGRPSVMFVTISADDDARDSKHRVTGDQQLLTVLGTDDVGSC